MSAAIRPSAHALVEILRHSAQTLELSRARVDAQAARLAAVDTHLGALAEHERSVALAELRIHEAVGRQLEAQNAQFEREREAMLELHAATIAHSEGASLQLLRTLVDEARLTPGEAEAAERAIRMPLEQLLRPTADGVRVSGNSIPSADAATAADSADRAPASGGSPRGARAEAPSEAAAHRGSPRPGAPARAPSDFGAPASFLDASRASSPHRTSGFLDEPEPSVAALFAGLRAAARAAAHSPSSGAATLTGSPSSARSPVSPDARADGGAMRAHAQPSSPSASLAERTTSLAARSPIDEELFYPGVRRAGAGARALAPVEHELVSYNPWAGTEPGTAGGRAPGAGTPHASMRPDELNSSLSSVDEAWGASARHGGCAAGLAARSFSCAAESVSESAADELGVGDGSLSRSGAVQSVADLAALSGGGGFSGGGGSGHARLQRVAPAGASATESVSDEDGERVRGAARVAVERLERAALRADLRTRDQLEEERVALGARVRELLSCCAASESGAHTAAALDGKDVNSGDERAHANGSTLLAQLGALRQQVTELASRQAAAAQQLAARVELGDEPRALALWEAMLALDIDAAHAVLRAPASPRSPRSEAAQPPSGAAIGCAQQQLRAALAAGAGPIAALPPTSAGAARSEGAHRSDASSEDGYSLSFAQDESADAYTQSFCSGAGHTGAGSRHELVGRGAAGAEPDRVGALRRELEARRAEARALLQSIGRE
ncbi:hypothetical protein KFE25_010550 [Diacronema lutheri]|uniref:Uncharacterized protein n=1 Tax=Diacronema lutheri TaxID=2081491 RepID=A0A8J6CBD2_DIALT|nr:hypothetical protein KFE25_010550 [Diacronema lutheri]